MYSSSAPIPVSSTSQTPELKRVIGLYYGFQFFFSLLVWLPIFYEYQKRIGLSDIEIFRIQSVYYIAFCLLEIPTGMLADLWGHRLCMRFGALTLVVANLLPIFFQSFGGMMVHFLFIAVSRSLISGASSAYLYDFLRTHGAVDRYKEIEGRARAYGLVGKVVFWSGIGFVMSRFLTMPYWLTVVAAAVSVGYALALPKEVAVEKRAKLSVVGATQLIVSNPYILFLMFQGIAIFVLARICQVNLFQPILASKSMSLGSFGIVMSLMTLFEALGSAYPQWLKRKLADLSAVFLLTVIMAATLALIPIARPYTTVALLCVFSLATGFSFPVQRQLLNDAVAAPQYRATILSIESIMDRAVCAWVASLLGASLAQHNLDGFLITSGVVTTVGMLLLYVGLKSGFVKRPRLQKSISSS